MTTSEDDASLSLLHQAARMLEDVLPEVAYGSKVGGQSAVRGLVGRIKDHLDAPLAAHDRIEALAATQRGGDEPLDIEAPSDSGRHNAGADPTGAG